MFDQICHNREYQQPTEIHHLYTPLQSLRLQPAVATRNSRLKRKQYAFLDCPYQSLVCCLTHAWGNYSKIGQQPAIATCRWLSSHGQKLALRSLVVLFDDGTGHPLLTTTNTYAKIQLISQPIKNSMTPNIIVISVIRDFAMYEKCIANNPFCKDLLKRPIDNSVENKGVSARYNEFLDRYDYSNPSWLIFCHEDFEIQDSLAQLAENLPTDSLYGPIGCSRVGIFPLRHQVFKGQITEMNRDGSGEPWLVGRPAKAMAQVETFDCCCLIVHSSLIEKHHLRFDENLPFDLYVEDFCAEAKIKHGIKSRILPLKAVHHSGSHPSDRLYRHLPYLAGKYPKNFFCASCTYFGTPSLATRLERGLVSTIRG